MEQTPKAVMVYAIYKPNTKSYIMSHGYYGNEINILCFGSKAECQRHIDTFYTHTGYKPKGMRV